MLQPEKFTTESEAYVFFNQCWNLGKYASTCKEKGLYLEIAGQIIELLKTHDFMELKPSLNRFYKIMTNYWNISTLGNSEDWEKMIQDMDKLCEDVSESQKNSFSKMVVSLSDYFGKQSKQQKPSKTR